MLTPFPFRRRCSANFHQQDVQFARYKSDVTAEAEGTLEDNKKERAERKGVIAISLECLREQLLIEISDWFLPAQAGGSSEEEEEDEDEDGKGDSDMEADEDDGDEGERPAKKAKKDNKKDAQPAAAALPGGAFPGRFCPQAADWDFR